MSNALFNFPEMDMDMSILTQPRFALLARTVNKIYRTANIRLPAMTSAQLRILMKLIMSTKKTKSPPFL